MHGLDFTEMATPINGIGEMEREMILPTLPHVIIVNGEVMNPIKGKTAQGYQPAGDGEDVTYISPFLSFYSLHRI